MSAKTGDNVNESIITIAKKMMEIFPKAVGTQHGMDLKETRNNR